MPTGVIAGTGHRFLSIDGVTHRLEGRLRSALEEKIEDRLTAADPATVIAGGALGFDMILGEVALAQEIPLWLALPFPGHDRWWEEKDRQRLESLMLKATRVIYVSQGRPSKAKFHKRNHWMVDHCDHMLALWDGRSSGTGATVQYAWSRRREVDNLWSDFVAAARSASAI